MGRRVCKKTGKVTHPSKIAACLTVKRMKANPVMNIYPCDACGGWHLGRTNDGGRWADRIGQVLARHAREIDARNRPS